MNKREIGKQAQRQMRADAWENFLTGSGTIRDKRLAGRVRVDSLTQDQTERLWRGDDVIAKLIEFMPEEALREGIDLRISALKPENNDAAPVPPGGSGALLPPQATRPPPPPPMLKPPDNKAKEIAKRMIANWDDLGGELTFGEGLKYERAHGGGALLIGANDGQEDLSLPLNEDGIKSIDYLTSLTRREIFPRYYYNDIQAKNYGRPEIYQLIPDQFGQSSRQAPPKHKAFPLIHESRLIVFPGIRVSRRQVAENNGWGDSVLVRALDVIRDFQSTWTGSAHAMQDFAQAVLKIKDIVDMLDSEDPEDQDLLMRRVILMDRQRSVGRMMFIDQDEEFDRKETPMGGVPETLDRWCNRLAFTCDIPVSILFGMAPTGLNASGSGGADHRAFGNKVRAWQRKVIKPKMERLFRLMFKAKDSPTGGVEPAVWSICFPPLWQPTDDEKAGTRLKVAQTDDYNISNNIYGPQDAASHYTGDEFSLDVTIDYAARERLNASYERDLNNPPQPDPGGTDPNAPKPPKAPKPGAE